MGKTSYAVTSYADEETYFKATFITREEALRFKDVVCDYVYYFDFMDNDEYLDITSLSEFVRNVFYYIEDAERTINSKVKRSLSLINPINVNYIKKDNDWYASLSIDVKCEEQGLTGEFSAELEISSKDDESKAVKDIVNMFFSTGRFICSHLLRHIEGDSW